MPDPAVRSRNRPGPESSAGVLELAAGTTGADPVSARQHAVAINKPPHSNTAASHQAFVRCRGVVMRSFLGPKPSPLSLPLILDAGRLDTSPKRKRGTSSRLRFGLVSEFPSSILLPT